MALLVLLIPTLIVQLSSLEVSASGNCTCVPFHQCLDGDNDLNTDGSGLLDVRKLENGKCVGHFDVCCTNLTKNEPTTERIKLTGCGYQNTGFSPWSAALLYQQKAKSVYINKCGVSLINKRAAITAAHCLDQKGLWSIRIGKTLLSASKTIIHPSYNNATLHNDIALIILPASARRITPVCIPPPGIVLAAATCSTPTWIRHQAQRKTYSYLAMARLRPVARAACEGALRRTRLGPLFQLHGGFMCASGLEGGGTCEGNGGNPLVCPVAGQPGRFHQVGIVSWGIGCGENTAPGVFVRVEAFREWIDGEMAGNGLDTSSYRY